MSILLLHGGPGFGFSSPWLPSVQLEFARREFTGAGSRPTPAVIAASRYVASASPLEAQPYYFEAVDRQLRGDDADIGALLKSTLGRNPRHYYARLWRARIHYAAGRIPEAVSDVLGVLPLNPQNENDYIAALVDVARDRQNHPLLLELLASEPYWGPAFVRRVNEELPDDEFRLALASRNPDAFGQHIRALADRGEHERAFLVWQEAQPPDQLVGFRWPADPRFAVADHPLGWRLDSALASREREGLRVYYSGRGERRPATQTMLLGGGFTYRLSIEMSGEMKARGGSFRWDVACLPDNRPAARLEVGMIEGGADVRHVDFTLPDECGAQRLSLVAQPGEYPFAARLAVHEVSIRQLANSEPGETEEGAP